MSSKDQNLSEFDLGPEATAKDLKIHIAVSDWNKEITHALLAGAKQTLLDLNQEEENIKVVHVPGTFELPFAAKSLIKTCGSDAVICLGCVIKGETDHDKFINQSVATTLNQLALTADKPVIFGVLTVNSMEQALDRAGGKYGNKGIEAAVTAYKMSVLKKELNKPTGKIGF